MRVLSRYIGRELHEAWRVLLAVALLAPIILWVFRERPTEYVLGGCIVFLGIVAAVGVGTDMIAGEWRGSGLDLLRRLPAGMTAAFLAKWAVLSGVVVASILYATLAMCGIVTVVPIDDLPSALVAWLIVALALGYALLASSSVAKESGVCVLVFCIAVLVAIAVGVLVFCASKLAIYDPRSLPFWCAIGFTCFVAAGLAFTRGHARGDAKKSPRLLALGAVGALTLVPTATERSLWWFATAEHRAALRKPVAAVISPDERFAVIEDKASRLYRLDLQKGSSVRLPSEWQALHFRSLNADACSDSALLARRRRAGRSRGECGYAKCDLATGRVTWESCVGPEAEHELRAILLARHSHADAVARGLGWDLRCRLSDRIYEVGATNDAGAWQRALLNVETASLSLIGPAKGSYTVLLGASTCLIRRTVTEPLSLEMLIADSSARDFSSARRLPMLGDAILWIDDKERLLVSGREGLALVDSETGHREPVPVDGELGASLRIRVPFGMALRFHGDKLILTGRGPRIFFYDPSTQSATSQRVAADVQRFVAVISDRAYVITSRGLERTRLGRDGSELLWPRDAKAKRRAR